MTTPTTLAAEPSTLDALVDQTPPERDRTVDLIRAFAIGMVVLWHWVFSVTHWTDDGRMTMPNFIGDVPGLWLATWLLQIMPLFFVVGGYANLAGFDATLRKGGSARTFLVGRARRLGRPVVPFLACWLTLEASRPALAPIVSVPSVQHWGMVVFVPLWFLAAYAVVVALAPLTIAWHRRAPIPSIVGLATLIALADALRFGVGIEPAGMVNSVLVWVFGHQVGYWWRDRADAGFSRLGLAATAVAVAGLLAGLVVAGPYARSMVAVSGGEMSNMFPTTAPVAVLAVLQTSVVLLLRPRLERWLAEARHWRPVVAVNALAMTIFVWHMTALATVIVGWSALGGTLRPDADASWWLQRPFWLVAPATVLALLVSVFARMERPELARRD